MDPLVEFAKRGNNGATKPIFDPRFVYETDAFSPTFELSDEKSNELYVNPDLLQIMDEQKNKVYVPQDEQIVYERANPFLVLPKLIKGAEMTTFEKIFGFRDGVVVLNPTRQHMQEMIKTVLLRSTPANNVMLALPTAVSEIWLHFVYLMTKFYRHTTMLQLDMSDVRYLVCMQFHSNPTWIPNLKEILTFESAKGLTRLFQTVPNCFRNWFTLLNNIHVAKRAEIFTLLVAEKEALDRKGIFVGMPSYDMKKVISWLKGEPEIKIVSSKSFKLSKKTDEEFVRGLHLFGEPENFQDVPLHRTIDMEKDLTMDYRQGQKVEKGGIHWGQRKLLLSEIDMFTTFLSPEENGVAYYIGAAPFDHGPALLQMFPNLNFILCDPRNVWHKAVRAESEAPNARVFLETRWFDENVANEVAAILKGEMDTSPTLKRILKNAKKFFFISDIRSTATESMDYVEKEMAVHHDMKLQMQFAQMLGSVLDSIGVSFIASLKFRLPFIQEIGGSDYEYGDGVLRCQPWARLQSTELRLWWKPSDGLKTYNKKRIESIMMYHNSVLREASFGPPKVSGYCECHDCHVELAILTDFVSKFKSMSEQDVQTLIEGHVSLFNSVLGMTLSDHADKDRKRTKGFIVEKDLVTRALKYNPLVENVRSSVAFEVQSEVIRTLKETEFKSVDDKVLMKAVGAMVLYNLFATGNIGFEPQSSILLELTSVQASDATISKLRQIASKLETKLSSELDKLPYEATTEVIATPLKSNTKGFYKLTTKGDKAFSTLGFHKSLFRRFLSPFERNYDLDISAIKQERVVLDRMYSFLKRLGPAWHKHLAYSLDSFFDRHVGLPGFANGGCLLSSHELQDSQYSEFYGALIPDLELRFTHHKGLSLAQEDSIVDENVITIFAPPVREIWRLFLSKVEVILNKYDDEEKAVVVIMPAKYNDEISTSLSNFEDVSQKTVFASKVWDTMRAREATLKGEHVVRVFRTVKSTFSLSK